MPLSTFAAEGCFRRCFRRHFAHFRWLSLLIFCFRSFHWSFRASFSLFSLLFIFRYAFFAAMMFFILLSFQPCCFQISSFSFRHYCRCFRHYAISPFLLVFLYFQLDFTFSSASPFDFIRYFIISMIFSSPLHFHFHFQRHILIVFAATLNFSLPTLSFLISYYFAIIFFFEPLLRADVFFRFLFALTLSFSPLMAFRFASISWYH